MVVVMAAWAWAGAIVACAVVVEGFSFGGHRHLGRRGASNAEEVWGREGHLDGSIEGRGQGCSEGSGVA